MKRPTQTILCSSDNCSNPVADRPWEYGVTLEPDLVRCRPDEKLVLTLKRLCARAMWEWIPLGGTFQIGVATAKGAVVLNATLARGNPTFADVARDITTSAGLPGFTCQFDPSQNKLLFMYPGASGIAVDFTAAKHLQPLLGFLPGGVVASTGPYLGSDVALSDTPFDSIKLHVTGVSPETGSQNGMNVTPGSMVQRTNVLAAFQVDSQPYGLLEHRNVDDTFRMVLADKTVRNMRFRFTDWNDSPLLQLTQNYLYLEFETLKPRMGVDDLMNSLFLSYR